MQNIIVKLLPLIIKSLLDIISQTLDIKSMPLVHKELIVNFLNKLVLSYFEEKSVSLTSTIRKFDDDNDLFLQLEEALLVNNFIDVIKRNSEFIEISLKDVFFIEQGISKDTLFKLKKKSKLLKYHLSSLSLYSPTDEVKVKGLGGKRMCTGLIRSGFADVASKCLYSFDIKRLKENIKDISYNIYKGTLNDTKSHREILYSETVESVLLDYIHNQSEYSMGTVSMDSRGRSIFSCTSKIGNIVSSKDMRALVQCPSMPLTKEGEQNVYSSISILLGHLGETPEERIEYGIEAYKNKTLLDDIDLHEKLWLERLYEGLSSAYIRNHWNIPTEIDAIASGFQISGVLINDPIIMLYTNLTIEPDRKLHDFYRIENVPRDFVKKAATPHLFGSVTSTEDLWNKQGFDYTTEQVELFNKEENDSNGRFRGVNNMKHFILDNIAIDSPIVTINNSFEEYWVMCNKFKEGEIDRDSIRDYYYYNNNGRLNTLRLAQHKVFDLDRFKTYFITGAIHNADSLIADRICRKIIALDHWIISNHDAWLSHPNIQGLIANTYVESLYKLYKNRHNYWNNYLASLGVKYSPSTLQMSDKEVDRFDIYCLK